MAKKRRNGEGTWRNKTISGIPYVFYRDAEGKYFYGKTEKAMKAKIKQANSVSTMTASGKKEQTFGEYMLLWLQSIRTGIEPTTYQSYLDVVNARLINYKAYDLANVRLAELSSRMFQDYLNSLAERYSLNSIKKGVGLIKTCIRYAEAKKDIEPMYLQVTVTTPSEAVMRGLGYTKRISQSIACLCCILCMWGFKKHETDRTCVAKNMLFLK